MDYYVVLGISPTASQQGIREAFRELARRYHPDHAGSDAADTFQQIVEAYEVLSDRARRASYDARRRTPPAHVGPGEPVRVRYHAPGPFRGAVSSAMSPLVTGTGPPSSERSGPGRMTRRPGAEPMRPRRHVEPLVPPQRRRGGRGGERL